MDRRNKRIFLVAIAVALLLVIVWAYFFSVPNAPDNAADRDYCQTASDCVAATCCHPTEAVNSYYAPNCAAVSCTLSCEGPLDCNAGHIECLENRCVIVPND